MKQSIFIIKNMDCPTEEALIRKRLGSVTGVAELAFNLMDRRLTVTHMLSDEEPILDALRDVGMEAAPQLPPNAGADYETKVPVVSRKTWALIAMSGTAAIASEILAWTGAAETASAACPSSFIANRSGGYKGPSLPELSPYRPIGSSARIQSTTPAELAI